jgi:hypothetical protein
VANGLLDGSERESDDSTNWAVLGLVPLLQFQEIPLLQKGYAHSK